MSKSNKAANAALTLGSEYKLLPTGFRYIKDYVLICGTVKGTKVTAIFGDKSQFGIRDMLAIKEVPSVVVTYKGVKEVNGIEYQRFQVGELSW